MDGSTVTETAVAVDPAAPSSALNSRAVVALTGMSYLCVAVSFSFLDRRFGSLDVESVSWFLWALIGFGAGTLHARKPLPIGNRQWQIFGALSVVLAIFPGFAMFSLLRWTALALLLVMGARAVILRTQRDFYLTLTVIFVVSFMVATHGNANWTLWFYLGPAWVFGGLALAWEHARGATLSRWIKLCMTMAFILLSFLMAVVIFFFVPRPPILGFGFLPPGTDTPGIFQTPAGANGISSGKNDPTGSSSAGGAGGPGSDANRGPGALAGQWEGMLKDMRRALSDRFIPQWQRTLMEKLLDGAQAILDQMAGKVRPKPGQESPGAQLQESVSSGFTVDWLLLLALLLAAYLVWRYRFRLGIQAALWAAWGSASRHPAASMKFSALAMKWCLRTQGHPRTPGQSVREHWSGAVTIAPLARRWLGFAVEAYCAMRFGGQAARPSQAKAMHQAVRGACDILSGLAPELKQ